MATNSCGQAAVTHIPIKLWPHCICWQGPVKAHLERGLRPELATLADNVAFVHAKLVNGDAAGKRAAKLGIPHAALTSATR